MGKPTHRLKVDEKKLLSPDSFEDVRGHTETIRGYNRDWFLVYWIAEALEKDQSEVLKSVRLELEALYKKHIDKIARLQEKARRIAAIEGDTTPPPDEPKPGKSRK